MSFFPRLAIVSVVSVLFMVTSFSLGFFFIGIGDGAQESIYSKPVIDKAASIAEWLMKANPMYRLGWWLGLPRWGAR